MVVPAIPIYVVLVWFLRGFFMACGWAVGTGQLLTALGQSVTTASLITR